MATYEGKDFQEFLKSYSSAKKEETKNFDYYCSLSMDELLQEFQKWMRYKRNYTERTIKAKTKKVRKFFDETGTKLSDVTIEIREAYKAYLIEQIRKGVYKKNYVSSILTDLNVFFCNFLGREDLRVPSIEKEEIAFERLTREDIDAMLAAVEKRTDINIRKKALHKAIIITLWDELPRVSELCSLKLGAVKELSRKVMFHSKKRENVPLHLRHPFATQEFLKAWNEYKRYRDSNDWSEDAPAFVQVNKNGKAISVDFVRRLLKEYAALAGINKRVSPHIIRKSGGTELSMSNPKLGQIQLGHKNIKTTLTNYTGPNIKDKQNIDRILNPRREIDPEEIAEELSKHYIRGELPEEEYLYALKSLRNHTRQKIGGDDIAFR